jgi:hypothetical protein
VNSLVMYNNGNSDDQEQKVSKPMCSQEGCETCRFTRFPLLSCHIIPVTCVTDLQIIFSIRK